MRGYKICFQIDYGIDVKNGCCIAVRPICFLGENFCIRISNIILDRSTIGFNILARSERKVEKWQIEGESGVSDRVTLQEIGICVGPEARILSQARLKLHTFIVNFEGCRYKGI